MSVWTEVRGCSYLEKGHGISYRYLIDILFQEAEPIITQKELTHDVVAIDFFFSFSEGGSEAVKAINEFLRIIKSNPKHRETDLTTTIRFLT